MDRAAPALSRPDAAKAMHRQRIGALLRLAQRKAIADCANALTAIGIGPAQIELLAAVAARPDTDQRAIGATLGIDRTTITALVDAAEERGWVGRYAGSDRRRKLLRLTEPGAQFLDRGLPALREAGATTLAAAGAGGPELPDLLRRLLLPVEALDDAPAPLASAPSFLLRRAAHAAAVRFAQTAGPAALPGLDYAILLLLENGLAETQADLLSALATFRSSTMPALRRLEAAGLIERGLTSGDRRRRRLSATRAAGERLRALEAPIVAYESAFLSPLPPADAAKLRDTLLRLADQV